MDAKKEQEPTIISKANAPVILAFLVGWYDIMCQKQFKQFVVMPTGNTVNMFTQIGNGDYSNVRFLLTAIANYCAGLGIFKYLDMNGLSVKSGAGICFGLHAISDQLRVIAPDNRFCVAPLSIFGGFYNALSAAKLGGIHAMQNGQYVSLMNSLATVAQNGPSAALSAGIQKSIRILVAFAIGLIAGAHSSKNYPFAAVKSRTFSLFGALFAAIIVLQDTPRSALTGK